MKKSLVLAAILGLFVVGVSFSAQAVSENEKDNGKISVSTSANTEIAPDVAQISFAVQTEDAKSMQKATLANKETSEKVLASLKSMINAEDGDYIKTSDFNATPLYVYNNSKRTFDKYQVSNRVLVHTKSIDKVGKMIDSAIASGATNVDSLVFSVSNYDSQCDELLGIASKKAKTRAGKVAEALGMKVVGIDNISTSCGANNYNAPRLYMAKNMIADTAEAISGGNATAISNGVVKINANVNASFLLK